MSCPSSTCHCTPGSLQGNSMVSPLLDILSANGVVVLVAVRRNDVRSPAYGRSRRSQRRRAPAPNPLLDQAPSPFSTPSIDRVYLTIDSESWTRRRGRAILAVLAWRNLWERRQRFPGPVEGRSPKLAITSRLCDPTTSRPLPGQRPVADAYVPVVNTTTQPAGHRGSTTRSTK